MSNARTVAQLWAERLAAHGVKRFFGVPGGDCSLDIIQAAADHGIDFILTRSETPATFMAAATAEITGVPGVVMTSRGPGIANAMNGVAYAALDRAPVIVVADGYDSTSDHIAHQRFDQAAMLKPLTKAYDQLGGDDAGARLDRLFETALSAPQGAVYLEMLGSKVRALTSEPAERTQPASKRATAKLPPLVETLLAAAKRPIIIAGFQSSDPEAASALRKLVAHWNVPVLTTYRAKGAVADDDEHLIGHYIGGVLEEPWLKQADLILFYGFDAIEMPPHKWRYDVPMIQVTAYPIERNIVKPEVMIVAPLAEIATRLRDLKPDPQWPADFRSRAKHAMREGARVGEGGPITPFMVVDAVIEAAPANSRVTLDAGAHMLPVLHRWTSNEPRQTMLSRGSATMGFALPAAIASSLAEPERPVIGFTGDGGLMMCAGELGTAVQYGCRLVLIVFNDETLTLIGARQRRRQLPNAGVDFAPADFSKVAEGFGCMGIRVERPEELGPAMQRAFAADGPVVVDVVVNPAAYHELLIAIRG